MPTPRVARLAPLLLLAVAPSALRAAAPPPPAALSATEVNLVELPFAGAGSTGFRIVVYSGSAEDPAGKEGLASLTAAAIARRAGPGVNVEVGRDVTVFTWNSPREPAASRFGELARALLRPELDESALALLKQDRLRAIDALRADPDRLRREALDWILYRGHPYGHPPEGFDSSVERITREEILSFHADHYRKGNLAVGCIGEVDVPLSAAVRRELAALPDGTPARSASSVMWLPRPRILLVESVGTPMLWGAAGHPLNVNRAHPDYVGLMAALGWPREPRHGILPRRRETMHILYESSTNDAPTIRRLWSDWTGRLAPPPDAARLGEAKKTAAAGRAEALREPPGILESLLDDYLYGSAGFDARFAATLEAVTLEGARGALERHLRPERIAIAVVTADAAALAEAIIAGGKEPGSASSPFGGIRMEDIEIVRATELFR